jgi:peptidoglycan/LPS O-acetylase OafA/YrhL
LYRAAERQTGKRPVFSPALKFMLRSCMEPTPREPRYETLDAWRGIACVLVALFHSVLGTKSVHDPLLNDDGSFAGIALRFISHLWVGVPLFFVISGYCIAAAADSSRRRTNAVPSYFARRFKRIYPPLWIFLILCVLIHVVFTWLEPRTGLPLQISHRDPFTVNWVSWIGSFTLTEEWRLHVVGPPTRDYFQWHLWTLCYEEQFYLVMGLIVLLARKRLFEVVAGVSVVVLLFATQTIKLPEHIRIDGFFFDGAWLEFASGIAVYFRRNYATPLVKRIIDALLLGFAVVWGISSAPDWPLGKQSLPAHLAVACTGAFLLGVLEPYDRYTANWKLLRPLKWCGIRCYSLYLVHGPAVYITSRLVLHFGYATPTQILLVVVPVCLAVSLVVAELFHRFVEKRFLNLPAKG